MGRAATGRSGWCRILAPAVAIGSLALPSIGQVTPLDTEPACSPGGTLVLPVEVNQAMRPGGLSVVTDQGAPIPARLVCLAVTQLAPPATPLDQWLGPIDSWSSGEAPPPQGRWFVEIDLPDESPPAFLRVDGRIVTPHWLPSAELMGALVPPEAWDPPPTPDEAIRRAVLAGAERGQRDPMRRWRWLLATGRLGPEHARDLVSLGDPTIDALALQQESRWRSTLSRLHTIDPGLSLRVRSRLLAAVRFEMGFALPAWDEDPRRLESLLRTALDPALTPFAIAGMVDTWLAEQPTTMSWVLDDALRVGGETFARVGVANLTPAPALLWDAGAPDPRPGDIGPWTCVSITLSRSAEAARRRVSLADKPLDVSLREASVHMEPPGAILGPLMPTWTMPDALAGSDRGPVGSPVAAGLLRRTLEPDGSQRLSLLVEVRADESQSGWSIRIWLGERGASRRVLRLSADGSVVDEASGDRSAAPIVHEPGRWVADVTMPTDAQNRSEVVVGLELIASDGSRATWPRRIMPWQDEPPRARIDLGAWDGLDR